MTAAMARERGLIAPSVPQGIEFIPEERLVTFEQLAELLGVPHSEIPALRLELADAIPIDFDHPAVQAFLAEQGVTP